MVDGFKVCLPRLCLHFASPTFRFGLTFTAFHLLHRLDCNTLSKSERCKSRQPKNNRSILQTLRKNNPKAFDLLASTRIHHHYMETGWNTQSLDSILKVRPVSGELECVRFNHYDRSPITTVLQAGVGSFYDALAALSHVIEEPTGQYWLKLKPGLVLLVGNWSVTGSNELHW